MTLIITLLTRTTETTQESKARGAEGKKKYAPVPEHTSPPAALL